MSSLVEEADSPVYPQDWNNPYAQPPYPQLSPVLPPATMNSANSSAGFQPSAAEGWLDNSGFWRHPLPDGSAQPGLNSSGAAGIGQTAQPQADIAINGPNAGAGATIGGAVKGPPPGSETPAPEAAPQGPPTLLAKGPAPGAAAPGSQPQSSTNPLSGAVQQAEQRIAGGPPQLKSNWLQRLGFAILSTTKLAPYAMQITHPQWTQQMGAYEQAEKDIGTLTAAQEAQQRGEWYGAQAAGARQRPILMKDGSIYDPRTGQIVQPAPTPMDRKQQALAIFGPGHDDEVNSYALGMKPEDITKASTVPWIGLSPQLQSLFPADATGNARVPTSVLERTVAQATIANSPMTPDRVAQFNQLLAQRYHNLHPGAPISPAMQLSPNATLDDYQNIEKAVAGLESQEGTLANQAASQALRQQTFTLAQQEAQRRTDEAKAKSEQADRTLSEKIYSPVQDSAERFNIMAKNYEDAVQSHDQQAMLSLLYNHMGMTMGLQKGARLTQALIQEAIKSRPWLKGMVSKFDSEGVLTGVTLTPQQMQQMVGNAQGRFSQDSSKARSSAQWLNLNNDGPSRVPSDSVKRYYLHLSGNDVQKATQAMLNDGWKP